MPAAPWSATGTEIGVATAMGVEALKGAAADIARRQCVAIGDPVTDSDLVFHEKVVIAARGVVLISGRTVEKWRDFCPSFPCVSSFVPMPGRKKTGRK